MKTLQEELKLANEELQSTDEELTTVDEAGAMGIRELQMKPLVKPYPAGPLAPRKKAPSFARCINKQLQAEMAEREQLAEELRKVGNEL